jgi:hypothetical protein
VRVSRAASVVLLLATACGGGKAPTFNKVPTAAATAPATARPAPPKGSSTVHVTGAMTWDATQDYECSYSADDFFIRGKAPEYQGVPVFVSLNVEFYKKPGTYRNRTQLLFRRVSDDSSTYASWFAAHATATILPNGKGADLPPTTLQPEAGTQATEPITVGGHFGCLGPAKRGAG